MVMVWLQRVVECNDDLARYDADESSEDELVGSPPTCHHASMTPYSVGCSPPYPNCFVSSCCNSSTCCSQGPDCLG